MVVVVDAWFKKMTIPPPWNVIGISKGLEDGES